MKRIPISSDFTKESEKGTKNMLEKKSFFGSQMMDIEDIIILSDTDVIYYQQVNNEQIDFNQEILNIPNIYSVTIDKKDSHVLSIKENQTEFDKQNLTSWILNIESKKLLKNYIFAQIKASRTFESIKNIDTYNNSVNQAINDYIELNIIDRYIIDKVDLFIRYKNLTDDNTLQSNDSTNSLFGEDTIENGNKWEIINDINLINDKIETDTTYNQDSIKVLFKQLKPRSKFSFDYYFNISFTRE